MCRLLERAVGSIGRCRDGGTEPPAPAPGDPPGVRPLRPEATVPHQGDVGDTGAVDGTAMSVRWMLVAGRGR